MLRHFFVTQNFLLKNISIILLVTFILTLSGCSSKNVVQDIAKITAEKTYLLSPKELAKVKKQIQVRVLNRYLGDMNKARIYGELVNGSRYNLAQVDLEIGLGKGKEREIIGKGTVYNIPAGKSATFDIQTISNISNELIDAEVQITKVRVIK
jgi:hypothetical protein